MLTLIINSIWLISSIIFLTICISIAHKTRFRYKSSFFYALGWTTILTPTLIGFDIVALPAPATYSIFLMTTLWISGDMAGKVVLGNLVFAFICWIVSFLIGWLIFYAIGRKNSSRKSSENEKYDEKSSNKLLGNHHSLFIHHE